MLGSGGLWSGLVSAGSAAFKYIQPDAGTTPTATTTTDTLTLTSSNGSITITGTASTDTVDFKVADAGLLALAAYNTNGLLTQTAADTFTGRTLTGTANQLTVTNGDGVSGNPTISLPADVIIPTVITVPNTGLHILDTNATHDMIVTTGSNLTADRTLTITIDDADRTLDLSAASVTISAFGATLVDDDNASTARTTLGLGTAAVQNTGTSGANVPLLNGANTWSATQTLNAMLLVQAANPQIQLIANSGDSNFYISAVTGQAATARWGTWTGSAFSDRWLFGKSATAESGSDAGSNFAVYYYTDAGAFKGVFMEGFRSDGSMKISQGAYVGTVTGGYKGANTFNATTIYENGTSLVAKYQGLDAELTAIAGLTSAADKVPYFTGSGTAAVTDLTSTARSLLDDTTTAAMVTTLGLDNTKIATLSFIIEGGGATITTGVKGFLEIPFACTINRVTMLADQSGSIVVDVWKDTYANYPPTVADTITAAAKPTITTATKSQDSTLTGWTTSIAAGDILGFNVDSVTTCQRVTISLKVTKT